MPEMQEHFPAGAKMASIPKNETWCKMDSGFRGNDVIYVWSCAAWRVRAKWP